MHAQFKSRRLDSDDPCCTSNLALAMMAADCDALLAANISRCDVASAVHEQVSLVSWVTRPPIPSFSAAGPRDALILADRRWLESACGGWPRSRILVGGWPSRITDPLDGPATRQLAIAADTRDVSRPPQEFELSSHQLLWDMIREELGNNPFALDEDPGAYLSARMQRLSIGGEGLNWRQFADGLIAPAYQQGLARLLIDEGLPLRLYGEGWGELSGFHAHAAGPVRSAAELRQVAQQCAALVHAWAGLFAHPIEGLGRPVVRRGPKGKTAFLGDCRAALSGKFAAPAKRPDELTAQRLSTFLNSLA